MKKVLSLIYCSLVCMNIFAAYGLSDFANQPFISTNLSSYASKDPKILLEKMKGDTLLITYEPVFSAYKKDYRIEFELPQRDTIWVKQVKKPKLNKHYYLCLAFNGQKLDGVNYPDGSPFFKTQNFKNERFVLNQVLANDEIGRVRVELTHVTTGRTVIWHIENKCAVTDISLQNRVNAELNEHPLYVGAGGSSNFKGYRKVVSANAELYYEFSAQVFSYTSSVTTKVDNQGILTFAVQEESTPKILNYYISEGGKSYARYKFVPTDLAEKYFEEKAAEEARAIQQAIEDELADSTFYLAIKLDSYVHDELTGEYIENLANRSAFVYAATKKGYSTYYMAYCNGRQLQLFSYCDAIENADKDKIAFLNRRGEKGSELREKTAIQKDKEQIEIDKIKAVEFAKTCKAKMEEFAKKQIFFIEHFFSTGEYHKCGVGVNIYNCFNKTIKYVEMTVSAYNTFNDLQRDEIGNTSKGARCIGPIAPKETGYYLFNELFWNENGVIHDCRVTSVKIIFTDNSSVSYSGWANIKKHYQEFFFDDRNPDYAQ